MAKYLVETYYTCTFKVNHYLDDINEAELKNLEKRDDGKFEVLDVKLDNRKTKSLDPKNNKVLENKKVEFVDQTNNQINTNSGGGHMILMHATSLNKYFGHQIYLNNYGRTDVANVMQFQTTQSRTGGSGSWVGGGCHTVEANNLARASAVKYFPGSGNITRISYKLFGIK